MSDSLISKTFDNSFNLNNYIRFINQFFKEENIKITPVIKWKTTVNEYEKSIKEYCDLGLYIDRNRNKISLLVIKLNHDKTVEKARSLQRNYVAKYLDRKNYDAALVAFYSEADGGKSWRLSFVKLAVAIEGDKIVDRITPAKRYSYLVGEGEPSHTAKKQLKDFLREDSKEITIEDIEKAFAVEPVTKEFFKEYKEKYLQLKEYLEKDSEFIKQANNCNFSSEEFTKKLMGQIAFLYFLQKKGWLGSKIIPESLQENEIKKLLSRLSTQSKRDLLIRVYPYNKSSNKYSLIDNIEELTQLERDYLIDIFRDTEHEQKWGYGDKRFLRNLFNKCISTKKNILFFNDCLEPLFYDALNKERGSSQYFSKFNCKIPFLNGGLFDHPYEKENPKAQFVIPNNLFSNKTKDYEGDGILDFFDTYNFTINEEEALEKEVAVDPEMLGKIFENLLEVKDRKSKGAFYTPREIVNYMCQQSLLNYLVNETKISEDDLNTLITIGDRIYYEKDNSLNCDSVIRMPVSIINNVQAIDKALDEVKVCDPAVGSGAFPLGMLNEIVRLRDILTQYLRNEDNTNDLILQNDRSIYKLKKNVLEKNLYAVDIEPNAVEITKLRLWLSLIVDDDIDTVNPLPNLEWHIYCGNSLIDEFDGVKLFDEDLLLSEEELKKKYPTGRKEQAYQTEMLLDSRVNGLMGLSSENEILIEIENMRKTYFNINDKQEKALLKERIESYEWKLIDNKLTKDGNKDKIKEFRKMYKDKRKPYFLWKYCFSEVFKEKGGFDIFIANPPYVDSEEMSINLLEERKYCSKKYKSAKGNWDIFIIFIEKGIKTIKKNGVLTYIVPNKLISADYANSIREIMNENKIIEIRDYSTVEVFKEADVYPVIFILENDKLFKETVTMTVMESISKIKWKNRINENSFYKDIFWDRYFAEDSTALSIIDKMLVGKKLKSISEVIGSATVGEAYRIKEYLHEYQITAKQVYKKFINTGTIDRYVSQWESNKTKYIKSSYLSPVISYDDLLKISEKRLHQANCKKIIIGGMTKRLECYYDTNAEYLAGKSTIIVIKKNIDLRYIIAILNSKLMSFYYSIYYNSLSLKGGFFRIGVPQIKELPIILPDTECINLVVEKVERLQLAINNNDKNLSLKIEKELDSFIYNIYDLNNDEISSIERNIKD